MVMVLFVLDDCDRLEVILDAWEAVGVTGLTVLHSSGLGRLRNQGMRDDFPLFPSLESMFHHEECLSRTLFTVVDEALVDGIVAATERVVGDLSKPGTGFLVVLPVGRAYGLNKEYLK